MRTIRFLRPMLIGSTALVALGGTALAAEVEADVAFEVEGVTVSATRSEKAVDRAPATVSVITSRQIEDQLATDIKDMIRFEPGVSVRTQPARWGAAASTTGRDGNSGFNIRGVEGNRVLILTDGVRTPDAYSFGAQANGRGDYSDLEVMKSVEILRGPASALYGSDGVAGAVSFITKDPADFLTESGDWAAQGRVAYSSVDDSFAKSAVVAGRSGPWSGMALYTRRDASESENQGENESHNANRTAPNPQDIGSNAILGKVVFQPDDANTFRLTYDHLDRKIFTTALTGVAAPPQVAASVIGLVGTDSIHRDRISLDHRWTGDGLVDLMRWNVFWQQAKTNEYAAEDRLTAADRTRIGAFDNRVIGGVLELHSGFATGSMSHKLVYGGDWSTTRQEGLRDGTVPPAGEVFPTRAFPTTNYVLAGAFLQDEIGMLGGRLTLYPALRLDYYELEPVTGDPLYASNAPTGQSDSRVSPKIGVTFDIADDVSVFANYGAGFKAPAPSQVNNGFANPISNYRSDPNPDLKPETSITYEAGLRLRGANWNASAAAFVGDYDDFISQQMTGGNFTPANPAVYQFVNLSHVKISGIETRGALRLGPFVLNLAASYAEGDIITGGVRAPLDTVDPIKVVGGVSWRDPGGIYGASLFVTHSQGKGRGEAGGACGAACYTPDAFTVLDATAFWNVSEQATLRAGVFNLTDEKYWWWSDVRGLSQTSTVIDAFSQPGRNAGLSLTLRL